MPYNASFLTICVGLTLFNVDKIICLAYICIKINRIIMFGKSLLTVYKSHLAIADLDKSFAELYLEWRAITVPKLSPNRFERKSIASCEIDPKIMSWLAMPNNIEQIPL